mmetsp:Transcript_30455/g.90939  ORF Transcript_30455/g.90939 Transcript_30455/m.90939 type:complete len:219 (+) Transcript_30455:794-1450(+)
MGAATAWTTLPIVPGPSPMPILSFSSSVKCNMLAINSRTFFLAFPCLEFQSSRIFFMRDRSMTSSWLVCRRCIASSKERRRLMLSFRDCSTVCSNSSTWFMTLRIALSAAICTSLILASFASAVASIAAACASAAATSADSLCSSTRSVSVSLSAWKASRALCKLALAVTARSRSALAISRSARRAARRASWSRASALAASRSATRRECSETEDSVAV